MTDGDDRSAFERLLFNDAPPPPAHLQALGQRFVEAARPKFRNFRVDLEAIGIAASKAGRAGDISLEDGAALFLDRGDALSMPLVRRYIAVRETELVARWLMSLPSFHSAGWVTERNLLALDGMVSAGEPALAVRVVRKHLEKTVGQARDKWRQVARKRPATLSPDASDRFDQLMARLRWQLPGEIEAARLEIAELEQYARVHGSPEDNRALDRMLADLEKARGRFT
ncbi:hypothetical protein GRI40_10765 [Altererythrobacter aerius]|uniref:Uncharacterized protein n=1 Tax=Tsuneonella aeria TaxID=1837929 RepID=A0A6I4TDM7_9SPHN|nr:hypothetical protein [Tsuneonella aeria]MXO75699.1 hypothetical protein [Tsuneonella aeria]